MLLNSLHTVVKSSKTTPVHLTKTSSSCIIEAGKLYILIGLGELINMQRNV
nr:MAG TPA: hypothetical protein [Caudoviricetes sp.]